MTKKKQPAEGNGFKLPKKVMAIAVAVIILLSFGLRMLPLNNVITDNTVQLKGADAYYFVRQAQDILAGGLPKSDPLLCYSDGLDYDQGAALYPYLLAGLGKIMPLELATAITSPILALVFMVLFFFLLKELLPDNDWAVLTGLAIAGLTGIQFISRSYFGFGDRHVLEVTLLTAGILGLVKAWNSGEKKWGIISGIAFLLYSYSWSQASLMLAIVSGGILLTYIFKQELPRNFTFNNCFALGLPLIQGLVFHNAQVVAITVASVVVFLIAEFLSRKLQGIGKKLIIILGLLGLIAAVVYWGLPELRDQLITVVNGFLGNTTSGPVVSEAQPMFSIYTNITFPPNTVTLQVIIFAFALLGVWPMLRKGNYSLAFMTVVLALISLHRIRTEYYLIAFAALGAAFLATETKKFAYVQIVLAFYFVVLYANAWMADLKDNVSSLAFTSSDYEMASWMRDNLPDSGVALAGNYADDKIASYGVMNDWQLGYLYSYIANKAMIAEPNFCNYDLPIKFILQTDETSAYTMVKSLGIKYILVKDMSLNKYYYYLSQLNRLSEFSVKSGTVGSKEYYFYNSAFYKTMGVRMYLYNGEAYKTDSVYTIDSKNSLAEYKSYEQAAATNPSEYYSTDITKSSVDLEALQHFKLVKTFTDPNGGVKLFEVVD